MDNYRCVRKIGRGSYGEVLLVRSKRDKKQYVLKQIKIENASRREIRAANLEVQLLATLRHPNIVSYKDSFDTGDGFLYIAMGYCEGGDLYTRIKEQTGVPFEEDRIVQWFIQICMALQYLHERKILHRDLKTKNIFLTKRNIVKVGDLGIAKVLDGDTAMATTLIGTPYYMSPELFSNRPYNFKSDVWALGCCIYELATLRHAFDARDMNSLMYKIVRGKLPAMPKQYSTTLQDVIRSMLSHDPEERPSVSRILRNPFVRRNIEVFLAGTQLMKLGAKNEQLVSTPRVLTAVSQRHEPRSERSENVSLSVTGVKLIGERSNGNIGGESGVFCDVDEGTGRKIGVRNGAELPAIYPKPNSAVDVSPQSKRQSLKSSDVESDTPLSKELVLCIDGQEIVLDERTTSERRCSDSSSSSSSRNNSKNDRPNEHEQRLLHLRHLKQLHDGAGAALSIDSNNPEHMLASEQPMTRSNKENELKGVNEILTHQIGDPVVHDLPPLSINGITTTLGRQTFDPPAPCLPLQLDPKLCNQRNKHKQSGRYGPLPPLPSVVSDVSDCCLALTEHQRPPNNTARQRRRQKQLKEVYSRTPPRFAPETTKLREGHGPSNSSQATTDGNNDVDCLINLLNSTLEKDLESPPLVTPSSSPRKCRRSFSLSNLEDVDVTKVCSLSRLEQRIWYLERDCLRGLGRDLLERVLRLLDGDPSEIESVMSKKRYGDYIAKLFQLKLCRDSLRKIPQM